MINECIIVSKEVGDKFILAKNRDRAYNPSLEIVHTIIDGVEVAYLHDLAKVKVDYLLKATHLYLHQSI